LLVGGCIISAATAPAMAVLNTPKLSVVIMNLQQATASYMEATTVLQASYKRIACSQFEFPVAQL